MAAVLAAALLVAGCSGDDPERDGSAADRTTTARSSDEGDPSRSARPRRDHPSPTEEAAPTGESSYSDWELGADPLPLRSDGLGEMRPTPRPLRERRFATVDLLPPPDDGRFHSTIGPVTPELRRRMGDTWSPGCPVTLDGLRYLTVTFRGFDGEAHTGELVVAATEAEDVVGVFRALFDADFPIEEMRLPTTADLEAHPTGDGNNTAALVCRATRGGSSWSAHAYGLAIDLNPFHNPYAKGNPPDRVVLPELASSYLDRTWHRPGMIQPGSVAVRAFTRIGWSWGGDWSTLKDYQHFSATGR